MVITYVNLLKVHLFRTQMDTRTTTVIQVRITHNPLYLSVPCKTVKLCVDYVPLGGGQVLVQDSAALIYFLNFLMRDFDMCICSGCQRSVQ